MGKIVLNKVASTLTGATGLFDGTYGGQEIVIVRESDGKPTIAVLQNNNAVSISNPQYITLTADPATTKTGNIVADDTLVDIAAKINSLSGSTTGATGKVDKVIIGVGLATDGSYTASTGAVYITGATSVQDALEKLNAAIIAEKANAIGAASAYTDNAIAALDSTTATTSVGRYITAITITNGKITAIGEADISGNETEITSSTGTTPLYTASSVLAGVTLSGTKNHALAFTTANKIFSASSADFAVSATTAASADTSDSALTANSAITATSATTAISATTALSADTSDSALTANSAITATSATTAVEANSAQTSNSALTALSAASVDGYEVGNASGNIPISNGTLCTNLNADMLDGYHTGSTTNTIPVSNGVLMQTLNADKVDGCDAGNAANNVAVSNGTVCSQLNSDMLDGVHLNGIFTDFTNTTATAGDAGETQIVIGGVTKKLGINAEKLDGYDTGNAANQIPVSNGTACANLNADMLDGTHLNGLITDFSNTTSAAGVAGQTQIVVGGVTKTCNVNADKVDGYHIVVGSTGTSSDTIYIL